MIQLYDSNGLMFWNEQDIEDRTAYFNRIVLDLQTGLKKLNRAFDMYRVEAPILTPAELVSAEYDKADYFQTSDETLSLRPETTMGSYIYARHLIDSQDKRYKLPLVVYQLGKSFRREQDKTVKNMRLKEFYQLEFQALYSDTTLADYPTAIKEIVLESLSNLLKYDCHLEPSDRIPSYSLSTTDVICNGMEVCSMSERKDFEGAKNFEVAIGMDRLVYLNNYSGS